MSASATETHRYDPTSPFYEQVTPWGRWGRSAFVLGGVLCGAHTAEVENCHRRNADQKIATISKERETGRAMLFDGDFLSGITAL